MPPAPSSKKLWVAVVDDHGPFRTATCRVLEAAGFATKGFSSVPDFIHSGVLARLSCLLLDVSMPGIDGFALQECLRATNFDLPIIFCSGLENDRVVSRAIANGAVSFLRKPVMAEQLVKAVRLACNLEPSAPDMDSPAARSKVADRVGP